MKEECKVCVTEFTDQTRRKHACVYCSEISCLQCIKTYVLQDTTDSHCMFCKRVYSTEVLDSLFTPHFRKSELRKHIIKNLMEREKSLFPSTMVLIKRDTLNAKYIKLFKAHADLIQHTFSPRDYAPVPPETIQLINDLRIQISTVLADILEVDPTFGSQGKEDKREFIRKCPSCKDGYLSTKWKCLLCDVNVCKECNAEVTHDHMCKQEDIDSVKLIEKETTPCPHCGVRVQKSEGCNQMWCTACKKSFDYRTGRKLLGPIHNPHYHEYQMQQRGGDTEGMEWRMVCENNVNPVHWPWNNSYAIARVFHDKGPRRLSSFAETFLMRCNRFMIERSAMCGGRQHEYTIHSHEDLRKKRILNEITDENWASQLSARETRRSRIQHTRNLDELILTVGRDVIGSGLLLLTNSSFDNAVLQPLETARKYYNDQMEILCKTQTKKMRINDAWILTQN